MTYNIVEYQNDSAGNTMLGNMYKQILYPAFPNEDERESLENLVKYMQEDCEGEKRHVIFILINNAIVGSMIFSYFQEVNAGFNSYIVVDNKHKRKGYASLLINEAMKILKQDVKENGQESLAYVFCEINKFNNGIPSSAYMIDRLGYMLVDVEYTQPPLSVDKSASNDLYLAVWSENKECIPTVDIKLFICSFFGKAFNIPLDMREQYIKLMYNRLSNKETVRLIKIIK